MLKTFKYRLYPSTAQEQRLFQALGVCRYWYNLCLSERKWAYELEGRKVTKGEQEKKAIHYRRTFPQAQIVFSQTMQMVCDDLDKAFRAFFRRVKAGETPGYPRFKGRHHFHSFAFKQFGVGARLDGRRLKLFGIGRVAVHWHRPIEGKIKTVRIVHKAGRWYACFAVEAPEARPLMPTGKAVGLDMGISAMLTTSDGDKVDNPAYYRASQAELRIAQRSLSRKQRGSKNRRKALRRVQRLQEHTANQRRDYAHKLAWQLINEYNVIALEDLQIKNIVRNHHLSKSILDSGWGLFRQFLTYKAESAGREIVLVNPAYTSMYCSNCGALFQDFDLSVRWVECACGLSLDRDHNAAINILKRAGRDTSVQPNVDPLPTPNGAGKVMRAVEAAALLCQQSVTL
jgi:putative transposase